MEDCAPSEELSTAGGFYVERAAATHINWRSHCESSYGPPLGEGFLAAIKLFERNGLKIKYSVALMWVKANHSTQRHGIFGRPTIQVLPDSYDGLITSHGEWRIPPQMRFV
jgi:hypothetical protein